MLFLDFYRIITHCRRIKYLKCVFFVTGMSYDFSIHKYTVLSMNVQFYNNDTFNLTQVMYA